MGAEKGVKSYQDLRVRQKSMDLVEEIYTLVKGLPKEEMYELSSQMRRASVSIPSNIAEGHARHTPNEFTHFLATARGSCAELQSQMLIYVRLGFVAQQDIQRPLDISYEVSKMLSSLIVSLGKK